MNLCVSEHDGGLVIFNPGTGQVFLSNRTGARIWSRLSAGLAEDEIASEMSGTFGMSREQAQRDVDGFVKDVERRKLLVRRRSWTRFRLTAWAWAELALHDARIALGGFGMAHRSLQKQGVADVHGFRTVESVCAAVDRAACFYVKAVRCLQRSTVMVRMLRRCGIAATLVIAYRPSPFFMHAFVEVDGRILNDSTIYAEQLTTIYRQEPAGKETR